MLFWEEEIDFQQPISQRNIWSRQDSKVWHHLFFTVVVNDNKILLFINIYALLLENAYFWYLSS